ncbi:MAG: aspartate aminotransferase family protein [Proteobacteria bacterium]|nr:aspartate aminotransferase family protein [Pseudomonadota bacterium]MBU1714375.1 aspartate aminotransferase family protein [Pseudomonadota bacterium]
MKNSEIMAKSASLFINTYGRFPAVITKGSGCRLTDATGKEYLDFLSGIAVCSLGHCYPPVSEAICEQAKKLVHVSNLFHTIPQTELAELLIHNSFADRIFMCNSGAEANEAAIKLARKYSAKERYEVISLQGSFHGRTLATVAATGQEKFHQGFEPLPAGFIHAPFGEINSLKEMISEKTCAVLCEPLQGEGGVRPLPKEYLQAIRKICDDNNLLLIFDEIQVGLGRTGTLFAYEQFGVVPDIMTLAKALANGLPIGAMLTTEKIAAAFAPGNHASTFGGNPVACAAAVVVLQTMLADGFLDGVKAKGNYLATKLGDLAVKYPKIATKVRGMGLIQGLLLSPGMIPEGPKMINMLFERGILANFAGNKALRFIPPLIISNDDIDQLITTLDKLFAEF